MDKDYDVPSPDDYRKEDLKKAGKILFLSLISALIVTLILYFLPI